jgi:two-component system copper resistance phosphate regulon response regulator CusR
MRLLVAEDEPKIGIYLQQGLTEAGFNVDRFTNGKEALQHALSEAYDLLILDVMMPGLDGWEVLQKVAHPGKMSPCSFSRRETALKIESKDLNSGQTIT